MRHTYCLTASLPLYPSLSPSLSLFPSLPPSIPQFHSGGMPHVRPFLRFTFLGRVCFALSLMTHVMQILTLRVRLSLQRGFA